MKKLTAQQVLAFLLKLEENGADLRKVEFNYQANRNEDVTTLEAIEEDLFDEATNNVLESIIVIGDAREL